MIPGFSGHLISESFLEQTAGSNSKGGAELQHKLNEWRRRSSALGPAASLRAIFETAGRDLLGLLGFGVFGSLERLHHTREALGCRIQQGDTAVSFVVTGWGQRLDSFWRPAVIAAAAHHADWCLLFNGVALRIIDGRRLHSRRFAEFDIDIAIDHHAALAALHLMLGTPSALSKLVAASDRHTIGLCASLREGVLRASERLVIAMSSTPGSRRSQALSETYEQALTIVYRILFLLFAETRRLVPVWHPVYRRSYTIESIVDDISRDQVPVGLWDTLQAISRLAHAGCSIGDLHVTPFNGRLFAPSHTPLAERRSLLDDRTAGDAIRWLATRATSDRQGRERIPYRDLGVEQLGGVYEALLDYEPHTAGADVSLQDGSGRRKATGAFYTPQLIAEYLVRTTLGPLVRDRAAADILRLRILDPAMGSGAFLVAACRYLADAYEAALVREGHCHATDLGKGEHINIRRTIAEQCLFGVDINPMAVQLARLSLWLTTLAADRPLTFLDHHLACGDSLLGAWLSDLRRPPDARHARSRPLPLFEQDVVTAAMGAALPVRFALARPATETLEQVRKKERALEALNGHGSVLSRWKRVADLWCSRWFTGGPTRVFAPNAFGPLCDHILHGAGTLPDSLSGEYLRAAAAAAAGRRFFHWELEFPELFFDEGGVPLANPGFDAIVGNPPWDMLRADDGARGHRAAVRAGTAAVVRFARDSGTYRTQATGAVGHVNRYQLFVDRAMRLVRCDGRIGLVLPAGFAADHGSAALRRELFTRCAVDGIVGFENRKRLFPVHASVRFLLLTATSGRRTEEFGCRLGESDAGVLDEGEAGPGGRPRFSIRLTPAIVERLSGGDMAIPNLCTTRDVAIAERAAALFQPLGSERGWGARFGRELNATDDGRYFRDGTRGIPIVEGKAVAPFRVDRTMFHQSISAGDRRRLLGSRSERPRLAYRDVASATNRLTLIAAILPRQTVSTHTVFCLKSAIALRAQQFLCGLFNSFVLNYLVRLRVTTHVTTGIVERLPVPLPDEAAGAYEQIAAAARLLARRDDRRALARLNAIVAKLYELSREEFEHVLSTFPLVPEPDRAAARAAFSSL